MTRLTDESCALRVKANRIIDETEDAVQHESCLEDLTTLRPHTLIPNDKGILVSVQVQKNDLVQTVDSGYSGLTPPITTQLH